MESFNKILISDKSFDSYINVKESLKDTGLKLSYIPDANEILKALESKIYDLIMIDVDFPEENGIETLQKLKKHPVFFDIPIIIISDKSNIKILEYCFRYGADDIISKPIDKYILQLRIKAVLDKLKYLRKIEMQMNIIKMKRKLKEEKYAQSALKNKTQRKIAKEIMRLFDKEKIYLKKDISSEKLAKILKINKVYLSQVMSSELDSNFYDLLNKYRIKEATKILTTQGTKKITLEAISSLAGYNSRVTFNRAFKKVTGITPSDFLNSLNNND